MLSVCVHKDVSEYQPKIVGKLTKRSLVSIALALGVGLVIGAWSYFVWGIGYEDTMYPILLCSFSIWAAGFWRPLGMPAEQFIPLYLRHLLTEDVALLKTGVALSIEAEERAALDAEGRVRSRLRGVEALSPTQLSDAPKTNEEK